MDIHLIKCFNADETGLWWNLMPSKSVVRAGETHAKKFKQAIDKVTLLACYNASGTCKLPLVFTHKTAKPGCFKNIEICSLLV